MKKFIVLLIPVLIGCSTITYDSGVEKVSYSRFGSQNLSGVEIVKNKDSVGVKIEQQRTSTEEIAKAVSSIAETASAFVKAAE